jgi:alpha-glucosidase
MVLLDSHDTARFKTVVGGDRSRHLAGVATLLTYPGVPSIFAGDEIGLEGEWGEDARRTIDWENPEKWDGELFSEFKKLVEIRKSHDALINGGLRWVYITDSAFAYLRESKRESILVFISRSAGSHTLNLEPLGYKVKETLYGKPAKGNKLKINSQKANCGIWLLK